MTDKKKTGERVWERGWDGHDRAQLLRMSRLSFIEKIQWLEEAQETIEHMRSKAAKDFPKGNLTDGL